jgi:hypothetical protein
MFLFNGCELGRVYDNTALTSAQGNIYNGALPGHPHGEGADRIKRLIRMKTNATLVGAARIIMLDAKTGEHLEVAIFHTHGDAKRKLTSGPAQHLSNARVKIHHFGNVIELFLSNLKRIDLL